MEKPHLHHDTDQMVESRVAQWITQAFTRLIATVMLALGIAILTGGAKRFGGLSYQYALDTPGAPWSWGGIATAVGILALFATFFETPVLLGASMFVGGCWAAFFAITFARAWAHFDEANSTAMVAYAGYAIMCFILAGAHLAAHPPKIRRGKAQ